MNIVKDKVSGVSYAIGPKADCSNQRYTTQDKYDYGITDLSESTPIQTVSYLNVKTEEEGVEWLKSRVPHLPDEVYGILARHEFLNDKYLNDVREARKYNRELRRDSLKSIPTGIRKQDVDTVVNLC